MEIVKNGICIQEKQLSERCGQCGEWLVHCVYKYQSKKLKHVIRCKKCNSASRIKK
ncbi:hypothetical protein NEF87_004201 [Candidatus Lokiarchaeum ossiferum]|uniref:Uncharacterized protein n=1 Tax=Candidatus Lokiarchaeum ossiferum TaxID=2951803 RepID=A0ABY6HX18_9ARCH|nr:hypothetical protein NEF87_004201 [Candidatus Lokiarchaeum sp. B-35]